MIDASLGLRVHLNICSDSIKANLEWARLKPRSADCQTNDLPLFHHPKQPQNRQIVVPDPWTWTLEVRVHQLQELDPGRHGGGLSAAGLHRRRVVLLAPPPQRHRPDAVRGTWWELSDNYRIQPLQLSRLFFRAGLFFQSSVRISRLTRTEFTLMCYEPVLVLAA